ncbi:insulinase family protein [Campylobacter sp. faydin G-105]|uniref:M16 family metallopeptidase n=1 Tax=Campylobacter anatolicus TaxID=2829105 RepID=UPI001BA2BA63|nr:pitrilysin family protein [Campylobacter anatolicus]MBR8461983.1 insulinase family protein [Campylobacter anatolicus]
MKIINLDVKNVKIPAVFESDKALPVVSLKLVFKVAGAVRDIKAGVAKMSANMLNEGTLSLGSYEFARLLEQRAISLNIDSGFETFSIELNCLKEHFSYACDMIKHLLIEPNLTAESLNRCKAVTLGEIASNDNDFDYVARRGLMELLYPNTPLSRASIGTSESVASMNLDDIKKFIKEHLNLSNLFIIFGGDVSETHTSFVTEILSVLDAGETRELPKFITSNKEQNSEILRPSEQAYIYFGSPFNVVEQERYKAKVATFILGESGFGSRLMEEIRVKRGLAYSAYARNSFALSHSGIFGYMQTKNEKKDEAIAVIKDEIYKFSQNGVSKSELTQAKNFLLGSLPLRLETLFKRLNIAQSEFYESRPLGTFLSELEQIQKLSLNELNEFIILHSEINRLSFCVLRNEI